MFKKRFIGFNADFFGNNRRRVQNLFVRHKRGSKQIQEREHEEKPKCNQATIFNDCKYPSSKYNLIVGENLLVYHIKIPPHNTPICSF